MWATMRSLLSSPRKTKLVACLLYLNSWVDTHTFSDSILFSDTLPDKLPTLAAKPVREHLLQGIRGAPL